MNDVLAMTPVTKSTSADDEALTLSQIQAIPYGVATLSDTTFVVQLVNFPNDYSPLVGSKALIKFDNDYSKNANLHLQIGTITVPMLAQGSSMGTGSIKKNQILEFTFIGTIANGVHTITSANCDSHITKKTSTYTEYSDGTKYYEPISELDNESSASVNSTAVLDELNKFDVSQIILVQETDADNCIPDENRMKYFELQSTGSNLPEEVESACIIKADRNEETHVTQICYPKDYSELEYNANSYSRIGTLADDEWTFTDWELSIADNSRELTRAEYDALSDEEKEKDTTFFITDEDMTPVVVDQTFDGTSENPQSGVAINGKLGSYATKTDLSNYGKQYCSDANTVEESISNYNFNTLNTPLKQGISGSSDGAIITSLTEDKNWGCQICLASGDLIYIRRKVSGTWTSWEQILTESCFSSGFYGGIVCYFQWIGKYGCVINLPKVIIDDYNISCNMLNVVGASEYTDLHVSTNGYLLMIYSDSINSLDLGKYAQLQLTFMRK